MTNSIVYLADLAAEIGVPAATLRYWRHADMGPRSFKIGRRTAYRRADVDAWLAEQEQATARGAVTAATVG
ncbi:MAG: helix-turn-helix transcriptional regulator [Mycobacterium sp.]